MTRALCPLAAVASSLAGTTPTSAWAAMPLSSDATSISSSTSGASNPLIPSSISTRCQTFLAQLNGDQTIAQCTVPLISTLDLFAPENGIASYAKTQSAITTSLEKLCATNACSDTIIRAALTAFNGNCSAELQARQAVVLGEYDTLYILQPFHTSVCSKDVNGGYCLTDIAAGTVPPSPDTIATNANNSSADASASASAATSESASIASSTPVATPAPVASLSKSYSIALVSPSELFVQFTVQARRFLRRRQVVASTTPVVATNTTSSAAASTTAPASASGSNLSFDLTGVLPNPATWAAHSLPFLFLSANMSSALLCTSCTKSILAAYVCWEIRMPYALGLSNSPMLGHQGDLWTGTGETCGTGFLASIQSLAGEINITGAASNRATISHLIVLSVVAVLAVAAMS
ncbi:BZ3500_MvSof-1268-A1-R1_Chr5-3g08252 [Microbotryum saponariae]|uniref:BZ3500_MvSof-1268-A1-R1_Chr5-3g08252 protein n=1 Tax=Microbotryum saponariae TaxID=289078 RepID=A0A2X0KH69_9BASI|nr:BZ3500_MvSof-1268-A1-R1_Chr5-3g08252 [Microbotryum saponariae]SDA08360.1 BZ3501_MvSof-1269-A2-R1_Chr5-3g07980 [Microbotryum saponariae]